MDFDPSKDDAVLTFDTGGCVVFRNGVWQLKLDLACRMLVNIDIRLLICVISRLISNALAYHSFASFVVRLG